MQENKVLIDISKHNGTVQWSAVKGNCDGAILRCGYRGYGTAGTLVTDPKFQENVQGAVKTAGLPIGVYWLSQAVSEGEAAEEAAYITKLLAPYRSYLTYPVYLDSEWSNTAKNGRADRLGKTKRTEVAIRWLEEIRAAGFLPGIYASTSWFAEQLDDAKLLEYTHWVADYRKTCGYTGKKDAWQYTSTAKIPGVAGNVDKSYFYRDFARPSTVETAAKPASTIRYDWKAGEKVTLYKTKTQLFANESTITPASMLPPGVYYIYDGELCKLGRYRITTKQEYCGKKPIGKYVTGYVSVDNFR